jgi:hypothetical protein
MAKTLIDRGGPAFPVVVKDDTDGYTKIINGMTLRDYFAAKAIAGFTSACNRDGEWSTIGCEENISDMAYKIADEMIVRRDEA